MKIRVNFNYHAEVEVTQSEMEEIKNRIEDGTYQPAKKTYRTLATNEINEMALIKDGRKEVGYISNLKIEVKE